MNVVRWGDCIDMPWRNGGGRSRELLAWPEAEDWQVRVSVAEIGTDGPFSPFAGIERWFAVLEGAGVVLTLPAGERTVRPGDPALAFPGEAAPGCRLIDGPTRDLNLMLRRGARGAWRGLFADGALWWSDDPREALPTQRGWRLTMSGMERSA
jgi:hypothetical protein